MTETIYALSSGRPPAAVAVIRISGPQAHPAAQIIAGELPPPRMAAVRQLRAPETGDLLDEALVLRFDAPHSATGEDVVEVQCHGGRAVVAAVLGCLSGLEGLRVAVPGEFTRRAFENGRIDLTAAEGLADLLEAETESQRKAALALAEGALAQLIAGWQQRLLGLSAEAERAIDYDEGDVGPDRALSMDCSALARELGEWLERPRIEPLRDGILIVAAGPPNSGKSSLINAISGEEKAIVTDAPGTTRDLIEVPLSIGGVPVRLTDTAGLRDAADEVEAIGIERAKQLAAHSDILLWLGEPEDAPAHPRLVRVHAKHDLAERAAAVPESSIPVSSLTTEGLTLLLERISELATELLPTEGAVALNRRQAAEIVKARDELAAAAGASDLVVMAECLRQARAASDRLTGRAGLEDVLDALFGRFCLGK